MNFSGSTPQRIAPAIETFSLMTESAGGLCSTPQRIAPAIETPPPICLTMYLQCSTPQRIAPAIETAAEIDRVCNDKEQHPPKNRPCD